MELSMEKSMSNFLTAVFMFLYVITAFLTSFFHLQSRGHLLSNDSGCLFVNAKLISVDSKKILLKVVPWKLHKENMRCSSHSCRHIKQKMGAQNFVCFIL
jgi:hypothetical protein